VPAFRSSYFTSAPIFYELRKVTGTSKFGFLVPLFHLKFLNDVCRLQRRNFKWAVLATSATLLIAAGGMAFADGSGDLAAVKKLEQGEYYDKDGNPTYKIQPDGTVDWYSYSGYRRYHSECHVCHGPDGMGSSYAPALKDSLKTMSYGEFISIVASGRKNVNTAQENVMPSFGNNPNVTCYLDDIYVYLRARANDAVARVRPAKHEDKPAAYTKAEDSCMAAKQ
jgi:methanol metabolism-related c-type cytochrome